LDNCYEWKSFTNNKTEVNQPWGSKEAIAERDASIAEKLGTQDRAEFDRNFADERYQLESALGGQEIFDFAFATMKTGKTNPAITDLQIFAEVCLRDTCVLNYRQAYRGKGWLADPDLKDSPAQLVYDANLGQVSTLVNIACQIAHAE